MQVVYLDVLFVINFCMDFLTLYLCGSILHIKRKFKLLLLSSFIGGLYAVCSVVFEGNGILNFIISIAVSLLLCYITYNKEVSSSRFFKLCTIFYFVSLLLGGVITAFYNLLSYIFDSVFITSHGASQNNRVFVFLSLSGFCSALILFFTRIFSDEISVSSCKITVEIEGKEKNLYALVDSGNLLKDPISGRKVIVVSIQSLKEIMRPALLIALLGGIDEMKALPTEDARRIRLIPISGISSSKMMLAYLPDRIEVSMIKKGKDIRIRLDALLGFEVESAEKFAGYDAIIPNSLLA